MYTLGKKHSDPYFAVFAVRTESGSFRYGLTVTRHMGSAVRRNRIKRLLRESIRVCATDPAGSADVVVVARKSISDAHFDDILVHMNRVFRKAGLISREIPEQRKTT
ncbi:ribonuclease P protein component [bacterium]|nr:ribonuclease P protein component [candidate division CSSED10-310 bacterium]